MKGSLGRVVVWYLMVSGASLYAQKALKDQSQIIQSDAKQVSLPIAPGVKAPQSPTTSSKVSAKGDFSAEFKQAFKDTKEALGPIKTVITSLSKDFQGASYLESSKIESIIKNPKYNNKAIGLVINFTYPGAGPLVGFEGVIIDPVIEIVPPFLQGFCSSVLAVSLKTFFNGQRLNDRATNKVVFRSSPFVEFLFKLSLLAKDKSQKKIDTKQFGAQLLLLILRISQTEGFKSVNDIFSNFPSPLNSLIERIKIQNKSINDFLDGYVQKFQELMNYDFSKPDTAVLGKKDFNKVIKVLGAIFVRAVVDYSKARVVFLKTPEGKLAFEKMKRDAGTAGVALGDTAAFRQQVPGFDSIQSDLQGRLIGLLTRFALYKQLKVMLVKKLSPVLNPLLGLLGMRLEDIFPPDDKIPSADSTELFAETDADMLLAQDPLFGEMQADTPVVVAVQTQEASAVDVDMHPIDRLYEVMDEYDSLEQNVPLSPKKEAELEAALMGAFDTASGEWEGYDKQDLIDFGYALLDTDSYVENQKNKERINTLLSSVKNTLKTMGVVLQE